MSLKPPHSPPPARCPRHAGHAPQRTKQSETTGTRRPQRRSPRAAMLPHHDSRHAAIEQRTPHRADQRRAVVHMMLVCARLATNSSAMCDVRCTKMRSHRDAARHREVRHRFPTNAGDKCPSAYRHTHRGLRAAVALLRRLSCSRVLALLTPAHQECCRQPSDKFHAACRTQHVPRDHAAAHTVHDRDIGIGRHRHPN